MMVMKMKCENYLCIYEENGICLLSDIELDIQGQCKSCIYVDLTNNELGALKKAERMRLLLNESLF